MSSAEPVVLRAVDPDVVAVDGTPGGCSEHSAMVALTIIHVVHFAYGTEIPSQVHGNPWFRNQRLDETEPFSL